MFAAAFAQNGQCADGSTKGRNASAGKSGTSEYFCRAENNVKLGRIRAAIDDATKAIEFDPKNWQAYELRALQYFKVGPYQNSIDDFHKAIELAPKELRLREGLVKVVAKTGESEFVIDEATRAIKSGFTSSFLYQQRADAYYRSEMYENAAKDLTVVLSMPMAKDKWKRWDLLKLRGRCYLRSKQFANAEKDCTEALAIAPDDSKTYFCRADVRDRMGKYKEAIDDLNSNIKYDPANGRAFSMRAKIYEHLGQKQKADADRKEAIRLGDKQWGI
jgi:tetratricopeptide (TPR) repeat protein